MATTRPTRLPSPGGGSVLVQFRRPPPDPLPEVERRLEGLGVPVVALLAEVHLETLHRLAQLPAATRVGVVSAGRETAHNLEHSIATAALPNIARVEAGPAEGPALGRLVRRVDAIVCSTSAAARVQGLVGPTVPVIVDDRALNQRAIQMLGAILAQRDGDRTTAPLPSRRETARSALTLARSPEGRPRGDRDRPVGRHSRGSRKRRAG